MTGIGWLLHGACWTALLYAAIGGVGEVRDSKGAVKRGALLTGHFLGLPLGRRLDFNPRRAIRRDQDCPPKRSLGLTADQLARVGRIDRSFANIGRADRSRS
jgi:hypothetical protein